MFFLLLLNFKKKLLEKRKNFFSSLNPSFAKDNKYFWKIVKPFFSHKGNLGLNIKLVEKSELIQNDREIANELNTFFKDTVSNLETNENPYVINQVSDDILDPVEKYINKYQFYPTGAQPGVGGGGGGVGMTLPLPDLKKLNLP